MYYRIDSQCVDRTHPSSPVILRDPTVEFFLVKGPEGQQDAVNAERGAAVNKRTVHEILITLKSHSAPRLPDLAGSQPSQFICQHGLKARKSAGAQTKILGVKSSHAGTKIAAKTVKEPASDSSLASEQFRSEVITMQL
jgi:hypothetical protein